MELSAEEELLTARVAWGDETAIRTLIDQHAAWIFSLAFRISQSRGLARKATVEILAQTLRELEPLRQTRPFRIMAAERLIRFLKHFKIPAPGKLPIDEELNLTREISAERKVMFGMILEALKRLPFEERATLLLREQGHLPCETIAQILGQTPTVIRKRLAAVRLKLRESLTVPLERQSPSDGMQRN